MFFPYKISRKWSIIFLYLIFIQQICEIKSKSLNKMGEEATVGEETCEIGTILFEDHGFTKRCFTQNDIALLATRMKLQSLIPSKDAFLEDDENIESKIRYFYSVNDVISKMGGHETKELVNKAFYDMLGGYLKHYLLPVAKYSFYAGNVTYITANNLFQLYERCKELLNTNGNSWKEPITDFSDFSFKIEPIFQTKTENGEEEMKACVNLMLNQDDTDNDEDMLVALPKMEVEETEDLSTIWLPFKRKHIFNIHSRSSAFILFRYYVQVSKCYSYQGAQQAIFNKKLGRWIQENVLPYLNDDKLYPAFGAVLRILETVKDPSEENYFGGRGAGHQSNKVLFKKGQNLRNSERPVGLSPNYEDYEYMKEYINWGIIGLGSFVFFLAILFFICRRRKKIRNKRSVPGSHPDDSKKTKVMDKMKRVFTRSNQSTSEDGLGQKSDSDSLRQTRSVTFEREKRERKKMTGIFPKSSSDYLPKSESDSDGEEVVLEKIPLGVKKPNKLPKMTLKGTRDHHLFRITEESENPSKSTLKSSSSNNLPDQRKSAGFLDRIRSKSPKK